MTAYTHKEANLVRRILVKCKFAILGDDVDAQDEISALWDTGAMCTCISQDLAAKLKLQPDDFGWVTGANNKPFKAPIYSVLLKMGSFVIPYIRVYGLPMDGKNHDAIIGMDVMQQGDLTITNYNGQTVLTFREPSINSIDYVAEGKKFEEVHKLWVKKNMHKCPCGSGKLWTNCHGKQHA